MLFSCESDSNILGNKFSAVLAPNGLIEALLKCLESLIDNKAELEPSFSIKKFNYGVFQEKILCATSAVKQGKLSISTLGCRPKVTHSDPRRSLNVFRVSLVLFRKYLFWLIFFLLDLNQLCVLMRVLY
jgi:hypothetical protein